MNYDDTRDAEQLKVIEPAIAAFIDQINQNLGNGPRRTVFLFPGGLASKLWRAKIPFNDNAVAPQTFDYDLCWLTPTSFLGDARNLAMKKMAPEVYRDKDDRIIVADGAIDLDVVLDVPEDLGGLAGLSPYSGFTAWCANQGLDCFVFGWDWRRKLQHTGKFFIDKFLPHFRLRVQAGCGVDPLDNFALVGHSAGGMVVNWILRTDDLKLANLRRAVTVGTPFYGYAGQEHRWFEGEALVNGPGNFFRNQVIQMISSLPACYAWQFMGAPVYDANAQAFKSDLAFPLNDYPSMDKTTPGLRVDPYDPQQKVVGGNVFTRYPTATGFDQVELTAAGDLVANLASPLTASQMAKFFNIRGVQEAPNAAGLLQTLGVAGLPSLPGMPGLPQNGSIQSRTAGSIQWDWFPSNANSPIVNGPSVPGDGTQPAWTARHLGLFQALPNQVITVTGLGVDHAMMMNAAPVLTALGTALNF
jgi:pimeloyl-ACP methyl ester carboxylesterase